MKDLIIRLKKGIPLATLRVVRKHGARGPSMVAPIESDMKTAAKLLEEAHLIITGICCNNATFAHYEAAIEWTRKHSIYDTHQATSSEHSQNPEGVGGHIGRS